MATVLKAGIPVEFRCSSCRPATAPPTRRLHNRRKNASPAAAAEGLVGLLRTVAMLAGLLLSGLLKLLLTILLLTLAMLAGLRVSDRTIKRSLAILIRTMKLSIFSKLICSKA